MTVTAQELEKLAELWSQSPAVTVEPEQPDSPKVEPVKPAARSRRNDTAAKLVVSKTGKILPCLANAITVLRGFNSQWLNVLAFDEFANAIVTRKFDPGAGRLVRGQRRTMCGPRTF